MSEYPNSSGESGQLDSFSSAELLPASETVIERVLLEDAATMISTVANNEAKALTFAAMAIRSGNVPLSNGQIHKLFLDIQGDDNKAWGDIGHAVPAQYARDTFEPIGAVAKSQIDTKQGIRDRFTVTRYGDRIGLAVTGMMLDLSLRYPQISLYEIFGTTSTKSPEMRRSPFTRLEILRYLTQHNDVSNSTIALGLELDPSLITEQVYNLNKVGLVEVRSFERRASDKEILVPDIQKFAKILLHPNKGQLPDAIHNYISSQIATGEGSIGIEDVIDYAKVLQPDTPVDRIRENIHLTIAGWEQSGAIQTRSEFSNRQRSFVRLNSENEQLVTELLSLTEAIMQGDQVKLDWGQARAHEILSDSKAVNTLLQKARESSPFKQRESLEEFQSRILAILTRGEMTPSDLEKAAEANGKPTSKTSILRILRTLELDGRVKARSESGRNYYSLPSN